MRWIYERNTGHSLVGLSAAIVFASIAVACSDDDGTAPDDAASTSDEVVVTTLEPTPTPSPEEAATIEAEVAAIYPGVPEGKAADWARSTCFDKLRDGLDDERLADRIELRFAGGDRPDPTPEQADQILEIVLAGGWCQ